MSDGNDKYINIPSINVVLVLAHYFCLAHPSRVCRETLCNVFVHAIIGVSSLY